MAKFNAPTAGFPQLLALLLLFATATPLLAAPTATPPIFTPSDRLTPVMAEHGMVASQEPIATREGVKILEAGGNAVDAAVVVALVKAVTLPRAGNLTGGGFMLVHMAATGETRALDYRETAPARATRDLFLNDAGEADPVRSRRSHLAAGVPGTVAGLALVLRDYGTLSWAEAVTPAIRIAEAGFPVSRQLHEALVTYKPWLEDSPAAMATFFGVDGEAPAVGEILCRPTLAATLRLLREEGPEALYTGALADRIVEDMEANGGLISHADLADYRAKWREPITGDFYGYRVFSMPPPSSGGIHLVQMLNILQALDIADYPPDQAATFHLMAEAMRRAYADRSQFLGDTDFVDVPIAGLTAPAYARELAAGINPERATPSSAVRPGNPQAFMESPETTHFSIMDRHGNAVANTTTLNFSFGNGYMIPGTGLFLNNQMDDFSAKPGVPNAYGLIGGEANAIEPGKRMLSSMTPTLLLQDGRPVLATGSPGGSRIINTVLQVVLNVTVFDMNLAVATTAPRIHHQWLPDALRLEPGISPDTRRILEAMGHVISDNTAPLGAANSVLFDGHTFHGFADPRREGLAAGF